MVAEKARRIAGDHLEVDALAAHDCVLSLGRFQQHPLDLVALLRDDGRRPRLDDPGLLAGDAGELVTEPALVVA